MKREDKMPFSLSDLTAIALLRQVLGNELKEDQSALHWLLNFNEQTFKNIRL